MTLALVVVSPASAKQIPDKCTTKPATRLCAIHVHKGHVDHYRRMMGLHRIPYHWRAEGHPALRSRLLGYWARMDARSYKKYSSFKHAPWLHGSWHSSALCVHHYEGAWNANTGNGYTGGMQFADSTWLNAGGGRFAPRAYLATPNEQLQIAYHLWLAAGWSPWPNTSRMCGL